jgi:hypothetical protein
MWRTCNICLNVCMTRWYWEEQYMKHADAWEQHTHYMAAAHVLQQEIIQLEELHKWTEIDDELEATVDRVVILVMQVQPAIIEGKTALMKRGTAATWPCKHNCREPDVTYDFIMKMTASLRLYTWYSFRAAARACMQFHAYWTHPTQHAHEHD